MFISFTQEQRDQARQTNLVSFLQHQGESLKRSGSEYEWRDGSQKVTIRGNLWFHQYERVGGDAVDFVRKYHGLDYPHAVEYLLNGGYETLYASPTAPEKRTPFQLPRANENMRRVCAYLIHRRGITRDVVQAFASKQMIYESEKYHNAVFVGFDPGGTPRHASLRGIGAESSFKGNVPGSSPEYSFHWTGNSNRLYLFEAPIDLMSFITLHQTGWRSHSYAACCGVADRVLFQMLQDNPNIQEVSLCLDHDEAGQAANERIIEKLKAKDVKVKILIPTSKDWNEDLLFFRKEGPKCPAQQS